MFAKFFIFRFRGFSKMKLFGHKGIRKFLGLLSSSWFSWKNLAPKYQKFFEMESSWRLQLPLSLQYRLLYISVLRSRSIFGGSGSDPSKIKRLRLRLRLQVNCKTVNYDFITTISKIFFIIFFRVLGNITAANCTENYCWGEI